MDNLIVIFFKNLVEGSVYQTADENIPKGQNHFAKTFTLLASLCLSVSGLRKRINIFEKKLPNYYSRD